MSTSVRASLIMVTIGIATQLALPGHAADEDRPADPSPQKSDQDKALEALLEQDAAEYEFRLEGDDAPLTLQSNPVFQWTNPARVLNPNIQHGLVFVWTRNGRAEVVGTLFGVKGEGQASFYHEFHSLAMTPLEGTRRRRLYWNPQQPGVSLRPVPEAPVPAESERTRLIQMRDIARRFSGYSINYDEKRWELTLLAKPLHRLPMPQPDLLDQGVFAMMSTAGTDPEVLLVIEAREVDGQQQWQYGVCRFTDLKTWVSLDDKLVWSFENGTNGPQVDADASRVYRFSGEGAQRVE